MIFNKTKTSAVNWNKDTPQTHAPDWSMWSFWNNWDCKIESSKSKTKFFKFQPKMHERCQYCNRIAFQKIDKKLCKNENANHQLQSEILYDDTALEEIDLVNPKWSNKKSNCKDNLTDRKGFSI